MPMLHLLVDEEIIESFVSSLPKEGVKLVEKDYESNQVRYQVLLDEYKNGSDEFSIYYEGIDNIVKSKLYDEQLDAILESIRVLHEEASKQFGMYLHTIILNMQSKLAKYKPSIYFEDDSIKDVEFQGCTIPFYIDEKEEKIVLLGISAKG